MANTVWIGMTGERYESGRVAAVFFTEGPARMWLHNKVEILKKDNQEINNSVWNGRPVEVEISTDGNTVFVECDYISISEHEVLS